ncbi:MAG TPA: thioredoxin family protein, partial [Flavisolibacter sp.]|nr:thioredoxin family protein [Flavisolibacter sp.]
IVFGGTWCGDTKALLPKFFTTTDAARFPESHITLIGVDHSKKTLYNLAEAFGITNVPTFIVMKGGKEVGRVVEYGKLGMPEKEVAQIISDAGKK